MLFRIISFRKMPEKNQNLTLFNKETRNFYEFSNVNLLFGCSGSGKTEMLSSLADIFSGKNKKYQLNGTSILPNDFSIITIGSGESLSPHLKLTSKSLIKRAIEQSDILDAAKDSFSIIHDELNNICSLLSSYFREFMPNLKVEISNIDKPAALLLSNLDIEPIVLSSSSNKWDLFSLISKITVQAHTNFIVFVDDFASDLDEELIIKFFLEMRKTNAIFVLTSNKPIPQFLLDNETSIYAVKNGDLIRIPSVEKLAVDEITQGPEYQSYEEYMLNTGYIKSSDISNSFVEQIKGDVNANILRILCAREPHLSTAGSHDSVAIVPRSAAEEKLYRTVADLLGICL